MPLNLTEKQIIQLAPDTASVKAAKGLATPTKWVLLEYNERAVWGHCQGSGAAPYQTIVDIKNMGFKCSCPSRKFPCKHGLGLLFLFAAQPSAFKQADEPGWVTTWLTKREEKAEKKEQKVKSDTPVDEVAQAKRQAQRHQKVLNGIEDLEIWMKDLLRNGLINVPERAYTLFEGIARRMVDAQAPGLANRLKAMYGINFYEDTWKYRLTEQLGKLYLLMQSYKNLDNLPDDWKKEIRTQVGYPQAKEEILAGEAVADLWMVLHKRSVRINELNSDTYWLYGRQSGRFATYIHFMTPTSATEFNLLPGGFYEGKLCFYKGIDNLRALFKENEFSKESFTPVFYRDLKEATARYREAIRLNPLVEDVPLLVKDLRLATAGKQLYVQDINNDLIPVQMQETIRLDILAATGSKPFEAFFLVNAAGWEIKSIWYQSNFYIWKDERN